MEEDIIEEEELKKPKDIAVLIGEYIIELHKTWKPKTVGETNECIGELYGFKLFIERITTSDSDVIMSRSYSGSNQVMFTNQLYSQHPEGGLKYKFNGGAPSREAKLASKNYLNGIERCYNLLGQYTDELGRLKLDVKTLSSLDDKPFGKEDELTNLRADSKRLEREIDQKIRGEKVAVM